MKKTTLFILLFLTVLPSFGQNTDVSLDVRPEGFIPARGSGDLYSLGGGAALGVIYDFDAPWYLETGLSYRYVPTLGILPVNLVTAAAGAGLRLDLGKAAALRLGLMAGGFLGTYGNLTAYNPFAGVDGGVQFNLGESFRLGVSGGYDYYVGSLALEPEFSENAFLEGFRFSLGASFVPGSGAKQERRPRLEIDTPIFQPVFPVFYQYYNENPLGTVTITNKEKKAISNIQVSFLVNQYMEAPKLSMQIETLAPGESAEVPILALFRNSILEVTEGTTVSAQVTVDYEEGGDFLSASRTEPLRILKRGNITWDDDRKAAAFVTANDPTVQRFARNIAAAIRGESVTAVNERLRVAMAVFQALNLYGLEYIIDPDSSYIELSRDAGALDTIQFPQQTLDFKAGDCDDLSVLYCALLESVGIRTAFITVPGHIFTAFALDMDRKEAEKTFSRPEDLIFLNSEAWVPVEITMVRDNFLDAWAAGGKQWRESISAEQADILVLRDAWKIYPPTGFASEALTVSVPQTTEVVPSYSALLRGFIDREIAPQVSDLRSRIDASRGSRQLINKLGTLYARYGLYEEAEMEFLKAIKTAEYLPSLQNLGNIRLLKKDYRSALEFYERARAVRGDNPKILISLARVNFELADYDQATRQYREAEILSPDLVKDFSYIVSENRETGRASAAGQQRNVLWDEE